MTLKPSSGRGKAAAALPFFDILFGCMRRIALV